MVTGRGEQMVCVTGAGGFIGSWLVKELLHRGYFVRGAMREPGEFVHVREPLLRKHLVLDIDTVFNV